MSARLYNNSIQMFQIQTNFKNTAQFPQYLPALQSQSINIQLSPTQQFPVTFRPLPHRNIDAHQVIFPDATHYNTNMLTRASTLLSGFSQEGQASRIRTTRIFGAKKFNAEYIPENQQDKIKNLKIRNYGPIQVLSHNSSHNHLQRSPEKMQVPSAETADRRGATTDRFMKSNDAYLAVSQASVEGHDHDVSQQTLTMNQSYTSNVLPDTEISAINFTILEDMKQSTQVETKKVDLLQSIKNILQEKSLILASNDKNNQQITTVGLKINKKISEKNLIWAWVACLLCMGIILGLLVFT